MSDHGSPQPPRSGMAAITIVLGIVLASFAAWWFLTADSEAVDATTPAAVSTAVDTADLERP